MSQRMITLMEMDWLWMATEITETKNYSRQFSVSCKTKGWNVIKARPPRSAPGTATRSFPISISGNREK